jgi:hypothetical protein
MGDLNSRSRLEFTLGGRGSCRHRAQRQTRPPRGLARTQRRHAANRSKLLRDASARFPVVRCVQIAYPGLCKAPVTHGACSRPTHAILGYQTARALAALGSRATKEVHGTTMRMRVRSDHGGCARRRHDPKAQHAGVGFFLVITTLGSFASAGSLACAHGSCSSAGVARESTPEARAASSSTDERATVGAPSAPMASAPPASMRKAPSPLLATSLPNVSTVHDVASSSPVTRRLAVWHVQPGKGTLQAAYATADPGDELILADGNYTGSGDNVLEIGKPITIRALNAGQAVLDGENARRVVSIGVIGVTIDLQGLNITRGAATVRLCKRPRLSASNADDQKREAPLGTLA